jgi:hypothetical protein
MDRRSFLALSAVAGLGAALPLRAADPDLVVSKDAACGCCGAWVEHLREAGFAVEVRETTAEGVNRLKSRLGIRAEHASCHTGEAGGYWIEGHVPAEDVARLLSERPDAAGLAVPGMPVGSPGMEMGAAREPFDVLLVGRDGSAGVFARYR